jgi:hypothetical protein
MRIFRKCLLVVSLATAVTLGAATNMAPIGDDACTTVSASEEVSVATLIFEFVVLYSRFSFPPG